MKAYHVTYPRRHGSIFRWGLVPRDTTKHNHDIGVNEGVEAVYVFTDLRQAEAWTTLVGHRRDDPGTRHLRTPARA